MHETIHFWNPYDKTNNLTLFSEKSEHVIIFDPHATLKMAATLEIQQYVAYQKMLLMLCFHSLPNLRLLTNTTQ